jgi:hypothetical protein
MALSGFMQRCWQAAATGQVAIYKREPGFLYDTPIYAQQPPECIPGLEAEHFAFHPMPIRCAEGGSWIRSLCWKIKFWITCGDGQVMAKEKQGGLEGGRFDFLYLTPTALGDQGGKDPLGSDDTCSN